MLQCLFFDEINFSNSTLFQRVMFSFLALIVERNSSAKRLAVEVHGAPKDRLVLGLCSKTNILSSRTGASDLSEDYATVCSRFYFQ